MIVQDIRRLKAFQHLTEIGFYVVRFHFKNYTFVGAETYYLNQKITLEPSNGEYMITGKWNNVPARQLKKQVDTRMQEIEKEFIRGFKFGLIAKVFQNPSNDFDWKNTFDNSAYKYGYRLGYETEIGDYEKGYYAAQAVKCGRSYEIPKDASQLFIIGFNANLLNKEIYSHF